MRRALAAAVRDKNGIRRSRSEIAERLKYNAAWQLHGHKKPQIDATAAAYGMEQLFETLGRLKYVFFFVRWHWARLGTLMAWLEYGEFFRVCSYLGTAIPRRITPGRVGNKAAAEG